MEAYGRLDTPDSASHLKHAESFAKSHPDDAALMLALGRIARRAGAHAKAREYLERSGELAPNGAVFAELGRVSLALNEQERAAEYFARQFETP